MRNTDIATKLGVSSSDVSQTVNRIAKKVKTVHDTVALMEAIGLADKGPPIGLTPRGEELVRIPQTIRFSLLPRLRVLPAETTVSSSSARDIPVKELLAFQTDMQELKALVNQFSERILDKEKVRDVIREEVVAFWQERKLSSEREVLRITTSYEKETLSNMLGSSSIASKTSTNPEGYLSNIPASLLEAGLQPVHPLKDSPSNLFKLPSGYSDKKEVRLHVP